MPGPTKTLRLGSFTGGLNLRDDPVDLALDEATINDDWTPIGRGGSIMQRDGDSVLLSTVTWGPVNYLALYHRALNRVLAQTADGSLLVIDPSTGAATLIFGPPVSPGMGVVAVEAAASGGQGPLYMIRSVSALPINPAWSYWDGAAFGAWTASAGTIPTAGGMVYAGNRVWAAMPWFGSTALSAAQDSRVWWSNLGDPRDWPAANTMQLDPGDGEQPSAIVAFGTYVLIFKPHKVWRIYDLDTGANERIAADVGVPNYGGFGGGNAFVVSTPRGVVFLDPRQGPMITDGTTVKPLPNGDKIKPEWGNIDGLTYRNEHLYAAGHSGRIFDYDFRTESWWGVNYSASDLLAAGDFLITRPGDGAIRLDRIIEPAGTSRLFVPQLITGPMGFGTEHKHKRFRQMRVSGSGHLVVGVRRDYAPAASDELLINAVAGSDTTGRQAGELIIPTPGTARAMTLRVSGGGDAYGAGFVRPQLDSLEIDYAMRAR